MKQDSICENPSIGLGIRHPVNVFFLHCAKQYYSRFYCVPGNMWSAWTSKPWDNSDSFKWEFRWSILIYISTNTNIFLVILGISFIYLLNNSFSYYWIHFKINIHGGKKMFGYFSEITEPERSIYQNNSIKKKQQQHCDQLKTWN